MKEWLKAQAAYAADAFDKAERAEELSDYDALKTADRHYWDGYRDAMSAAAIEYHREFWANIARANGWYSEPFYVQVWFGPDGAVYDAVASRGMTRDIVLHLTEDDLEELEND